MNNSELENLKNEIEELKTQSQDDSNLLKSNLTNYISQNTVRIKNIIEEGVSKGEIILKATGRYLERVFKIEFIKDSIYKFLGDIFLIASGIFTIGFMIFKAVVGGSQDIVANLVVADGNTLFLSGGRCLEINKKSPNVGEKYTLHDDHQYNMDIFDKIEKNIKLLHYDISVRFGIPQNYDCGNETIKIRQALIWLYQTDSDPIDLLRKLFGTYSLIRFEELIFLIKTDIIFVSLFNEKSASINNFRTGLANFLQYNFNTNRFTENEIATIEDSGFFKFNK